MGDIMDASSHSHFTSTSQELKAEINGTNRRSGTRRSDRRVWPNAPCTASFPLPLYSCDTNGTINGFNDAAMELWGRRPDTALPGQWSGALALLNDQGTVLPRSKFSAAYAFHTGTDSVGTHEIFARPDGSTRRVLTYAKPARDGAGNICEVMCAMVEQTSTRILIEAAGRVEDEKNEFITMLSHELRNPLSPILTAAVLMKKVSPDHQVSKLADVMERQAKRLARFVQDLLHTANLTQGGVVLQRKKTPLSEVMQAALDSLWAAASSRKQVVSVELGPDVMLMCDAERLSQALGNVMINASEFTGDGGNIDVRTTVDGRWIRIEVEDSGIGIERAHLEDIFEPYTHFTTHIERARAGAGVGLALAKDICEKHGGAIAVNSPGPGHGSHFIIELPVVEASTSAD